MTRLQDESTSLVTHCDRRIDILKLKGACTFLNYNLSIEEYARPHILR